jgi:hypothetical protein
MVVKLLVAFRVPASAPHHGRSTTPTPPALMATKGICKIKNGWVHQDSVWVRYDDGKRLEIPASQYAEQGFQPPIAELPECKGMGQDA